MSPEQIGGDIEAVKATSDIYSVGVILYQLLTGYLPFYGQREPGVCWPPLRSTSPVLPKRIRTSMSRRKSRPWSCAASRRTRRNVPPSARALAEEFHRLVAPLGRVAVASIPPIVFTVAAPGWPWWE